MCHLVYTSAALQQLHMPPGSDLSVSGTGRSLLAYMLMLPLSVTGLRAHVMLASIAESCSLQVLVFTWLDAPCRMWVWV